MKSIRMSMMPCHALILLSFAVEKQVSMSYLAKSLGVTTAGITGIADDLEKRSFAKRQSSSTDRRLIHLTITPAGLAFLELLKSSISRNFADS
jgi:MarR family transcriptional repressor of emrRAB